MYNDELEQLIDAALADGELTEKEKQPISTYSKVYSCKSEGFKSKNNYTIESINSVIKVLNRQFTGVFDRGYDDNKIISNMVSNKKLFSLILRKFKKGSPFLFFYHN